MTRSSIIDVLKCAKHATTFFRITFKPRRVHLNIRLKRPYVQTLQKCLNKANTKERRYGEISSFSIFLEISPLPQTNTINAAGK